MLMSGPFSLDISAVVLTRGLMLVLVSIVKTRLKGLKAERMFFRHVCQGYFLMIRTKLHPRKPKGEYKHV